MQNCGITLRPISSQENFPQKENFAKYDWSTQVENFQLLTMIFSENFLSVEIFLEWKRAFTIAETISGHKVMITLQKQIG